MCDDVSNLGRERMEINTDHEEEVEEEQQQQTTATTSTTLSLSKQDLDTVDLCNIFSLPITIATTTTTTESSSALTKAAATTTTATQLRTAEPPLSLPSISLKPTMAMALRHIIRLDLSRNKLTSLPKELFGREEDTTDNNNNDNNNNNTYSSCPMLEYLNVGRNNLKGLPSELRYCTRLKTLIVLSNHLRWTLFPIDSIVSLPRLELLDLRWNRKMNTQSTRRRLLDNDKFTVSSSSSTATKTTTTTTTTLPVVVQDNSGDTNALNGDSASGHAAPCILILSAEKTTTTNNSKEGEDDHNYNHITSNNGITSPPPSIIKKKKKKLSACDRNANELRSQLEPLSTPQLRKRLDRIFGVSYDDTDEKAYDRDVIMQTTLHCYEKKWNEEHGKALLSSTTNNITTTTPGMVQLRSIRYEHGMSIDPVLLSELLIEMERIPWPKTTRERPKVLAEGYVILQRPPSSSSSSSSLLCHDNHDIQQANNTKKTKKEAAKLQRFISIWRKAMEVIESVDNAFAKKFTALGKMLHRIIFSCHNIILLYVKMHCCCVCICIRSIDLSITYSICISILLYFSAFTHIHVQHTHTHIAVTKNFTGSPHIDTLNVAPFYGLSLGDFTGGQLCVEVSPIEVAHIDTHNKIAKVDGRFPHWVADHTGTRYSLIYYITSGEVVPQTTAIFQPAPSYNEHAEEKNDAETWVSPPVFAP